MADRVKITNASDVGKSVNKKLGKKLKSINKELSRINNKLDQLEDVEKSVAELTREVDNLKRRIETIEKQKARAEREAVEDLKNVLQEQFEEKRREYERRVAEVLDDYRDAVERLKDRFLGAIAGQEENFAQVEEEFDAVQEQRQACMNAIGEVGRVPSQTHRDRLDSVIQSRNDFLNAIDDFLEDREDTAETIDSLQTSVPGISDKTMITIPFWVVGIQKNGQEEVQVYPMLERGSPAKNPARRQPYVNYINTHSTHRYGDMVDAVQSYVTRDTVRDALARQEGEFEDPSWLRETGAVMDRFVDALVAYEFDERGGRQDAARGDTASQRKGVKEVPADG